MFNYTGWFNKRQICYWENASTAIEVGMKFHIENVWYIVSQVNQSVVTLELWT